MPAGYAIQPPNRYLRPVLLVIGGNFQQDNPHGEEGSETGRLMQRRLIERRVTTFIDAFYGGDVEVATACCADDFNTITYAPIELFPHLGLKHGRDWVAQGIAIQEERFSRRTHKLAFLVADENKAATMGTVHLQKRNDSRIIELTIADLFSLHDDRIVTHRSFYDSFSLVQQILGRDLSEAFASSLTAAFRSDGSVNRS